MNKKVVSKISLTVGKRLKEARQAEKITQKQISEELNKYQSDYSDYETGKVELDYEKIVYLCKRYKITPNDLFDFE